MPLKPLRRPPALRPLYWVPDGMPSANAPRDDGSTLYGDTSERPPVYRRLPATKTNARSGALAAARWLVATQVNTVEGLSGDTGRYCGIHGLFDGARYHAQNWLSAHGVLATLAAWHETGDPAFLASARLGGEYLLGLQVHDRRLLESFGCYREHHARFPLTGSRSCASVIWAMVQLWRATGDREYLDSADLCGQWWLDQVWPEDRLAPPQDWNLRTRRWLHDWSGCFQGGVGVIFQQLAHATGKEIYRQRVVLRMADLFLERFLRRDGSRIQAILLDGRPTEQNARSFHLWNDDFAGISLLAAWQETGKRRYLDAALRLARWLKRTCEKDGRLGGVNSAPATALVFLNDLTRLTGSRDFDAVRGRFVSFLLRWQVADVHAASAHGGIRGQSHIRGADETGQFIDCRVTSYAVNALLGFADPRARVLLESEPPA